MHSLLHKVAPRVELDCSTAASRMARRLGGKERDTAAVSETCLVVQGLQAVLFVQEVPAPLVVHMSLVVLRVRLAVHTYRADWDTLAVQDTVVVQDTVDQEHQAVGIPHSADTSLAALCVHTVHMENTEKVDSGSVQLQWAVHQATQWDRPRVTE